MRVPHFSQYLTLELRREDPGVTGIAQVRPELFAPGTSHIRTSLLLAMVDIVAGHTPDGPGKPATGATLDLRATILAPPPTTGVVDIRCRPLRVGRRFVVSDIGLFAAGADRAEGADRAAGGAPFARATATFLVLSLSEGAPPGRPPLLPMDEGSFDEFLGARIRDERTLVMDASRRVANGPVGTVHGGAQVLLAELAAEHALGARGRGLIATDIDIHYLDRLRAGPLAASARLASTESGTPLAVVTLSDSGDGDRPIGHAVVTFGRAQAAAHRDGRPDGRPTAASGQ
jgi:uncharacterized protein (TIGR00369 family)